MSPSTVKPRPDPFGFPRVSGDEPAWQLQGYNAEQFSPRERG